MNKQKKKEIKKGKMKKKYLGYNLRKFGVNLYLR